MTRGKVSMDAHSASLQDLERNAWRYDVQDGLLEVVAGFMFLVIARVVADPHLAWMVVVLVFALRFALKVMKERFTYPRIGYVKLRSEDGRKLGLGMLRHVVIVVVTLAVGLWLFSDITSLAAWRRWSPALAGAFSAGGLWYLADKSGLVRHRMLAVICVGWGIVCAAWLDAPGYLGVQRWAVGLGMVCLITGGITFFQFVREHPLRAVEEADDNA